MNKRNYTIASILICCLLVSLLAYMKHKHSLLYQEYLDDNIGKPASELLVRAEHYAKHKGRALDLGAGAGNEVAYLLEKGWQVTAVDAQPRALKILETRKDFKNRHLLTLHQLPLEKLAHVHWGQYELVMAHYALSFTGPQMAMLLKHTLSLVQPGGIVSLRVFGPELVWAHAPKHRTVDAETLRLWLSDMEILEFSETKSPSVKNGVSALTHSLNIIARKPS